MPTAATKLLNAFKPAPKVTQPVPAKPQSLLVAPDECLIADLEEIRLAIDALAGGEPVDNVAAYRAAAIRRNFTPILESFAIAALRSIGDLSTWPAEYSERLEQIERDETHWAAEYRKLDLELTAARAKHRAAVGARENLRAENQQARYIKQVNPFLFGTAEQAAEAITVPALTADEAARLIGQQYQSWAIDQAREVKLHYAEQDAKGAREVMIDRRTQTSYHEAGHAVVCAVRGVRVFCATIIPSGTTNGLTVHQNSKSKVDTHCAILLAGGLAVWELGWRRGEKLPDGCYQDLEKFDEYLRELGARDYDPERRETWDEYKAGERIALEIIGGFWGAIEAVAAALLKLGTIRGELVHSLVATHKQKAEATK